MCPTLILRRKALFLIVVTVLMAAGFATPALAQSSGGATQGYIGSDPSTTPPALPRGSVTTASPPVRAEPPTLPPVFDTVRASEPAKQEEPAVADPCADFAGSYDGYNMCQDRIKKIERMRDAKNRRMGITPQPVVVPEKQLTPEEAAQEAAKETSEKVDEIERKLKEKEAADAAAKAAPTTKKGIGAFDRNPEKGSGLFR
jgi:hypothetical protein